MDVELERTGTLSVATEEHQIAWLAEEAGFLDGPATRALVDSPTFLAGAWDRHDTALVHPGQARPRAGPGRHRPGRADLRAVPGRGRRRRPGRPDGPRRGARRPRRAGHQRVPVAAAAQPAADRAGLRLRAGHRAAQRGTEGGHRLAGPPGGGRSRQPLPLLPAHRGRPDPVRWVRRRLPLGRPGACRVRGPAGDVREAGESPADHVPAAGGPPDQSPLGRRDRHLLPVLRLLRHRSAGTGRVRRRLHRAGSRAPPASPPT